jgi:hypothetical protein
MRGAVPPLPHASECKDRDNFSFYTNRSADLENERGDSRGKQNDISQPTFSSKCMVHYIGLCWI